MNKIIIDGENAVLGRLGSYAAKQLLLGHEVDIINAEKILITGNKADIVDKIKILRKKGGSSQNGPKISKLPDMLVKRMIREMLPWDRTRGREAHKRLKCYVGNPSNSKAIKLNHPTPIKSVTIAEVASLL